MNACKNCGTSIVATAKFCPECGTKIEKEVKCSNCGSKLAENAKFCMECGTKVGDVNSQIKEEPIELNAPDMDVNDDYVSSSTYVNEVLPFSDGLHKTPNGEQVSESEFSVVYTLSNHPSIVAKILEMVNKYNKRAAKYDFPLIEFNQETYEIRGDFRPLRKTQGMNYFKEVMLAGRNNDLCCDFLKICKLCENIMINE